MKKRILILVAISMLMVLVVGCNNKKEVVDMNPVVSGDILLDNDVDKEEELIEDEVVALEEDEIIEETVIEDDMNKDKEPEVNKDKDKVTTPDKDKVTTPNKDKPTTPNKPADTDKDKEKDKVVVEEKVINIKDIHAAVKNNLGSNYFPNMEMSIDLLEGLVGLNSGDIEEVIAEMPMISAQVDTFIAIKAKDGKIKDVQNSLNAYRKNLISDSMQYPMNLAKVNASKVVIKGDYAFFIMLGAIDEREDISEEETLEFAKAEVKKAEDIINKFFE